MKAASLRVTRKPDVPGATRLFDLSKKEVLDGVRLITEQRYADKLAETFIQFLSNNLSVYTTLLVKVFHIKGRTIVALEQSNFSADQEASTMGLFQALKASVLECVQQEAVLQVQAKKQAWLLSPIYFAKGEPVDQVFCIDLTDVTQEEVAVLKSFIAIYENLLNVIEDGRRDSLTGLLNRKSFSAGVVELINRVKRLNRQLSGQPDGRLEDRRRPVPESGFWLAIMDIDHFKQINDTFGHVYGDEVLMMVATVLKDTFRGSDLLFRYGGEEFVVLLGPLEKSVLIGVLERVRAALARKTFGKAGTITVSVGATKVMVGDFLATLTGRADRALYYSKENGRNKLSMYEDLVAQQQIPEIELPHKVKYF